MDKVKKYVLDNFEGLFVLTILISISLINFLIYSKIAFLNFYYLPIMIAGYYLGKRMAVLGAFFTILMVWVFVLADLENYYTQAGHFDLYFNLTVWSGFLILAGWVIGSLKDKLRFTDQLREELEQEKDLLKISHEQLNEYSAKLENKVSERTQELTRSQETVESLKEKAENALYSVMDAKVARLMIEGKLRNEKQRISILFSDLKDFTQFSDQHSPEEVMAELNSYLYEMEDCIIQFHGHIDKYMGDGIMVEFGAPVHHPMHSLMAVLAGLYMQKRLKQTHPHWQMRVGIATGPTVMGLLGSKRKSYSCIGDPANLAARMEQLCEPGGLFVDEETYFDVKPYVLANRVRSFGWQRESDQHLKVEIEALQAEMIANPTDVDKLFALGLAFFRKRSATAAIECFQQVLKQSPGHEGAKMGLDEAKRKQDEYEKIAIKGKPDRVAVYEILGVNDPMQDLKIIPEAFRQRYAEVASQFKIPDEVVLPVECLDGSVNHGKMVAILAYAMIEKMGGSPQEKEDILVAGILHDIGKLIVPRAALARMDQMSDSEMEIFRKHPEESSKIIKKLGYQSEDLLQVVETHHEHFDGSGYPLGLKGEAIPLGARVLAVANGFDNLTSVRRYKNNFSYQDALQQIHQETQAGKFDMRCVQTLTDLLNAAEDKMPAAPIPLHKKTG